MISCASFLCRGKGVILMTNFFDGEGFISSDNRYGGGRSNIFRRVRRCFYITLFLVLMVFPAISVAEEAGGIREGGGRDSTPRATYELGGIYDPLSYRIGRTPDEWIYGPISDIKAEGLIAAGYRGLMLTSRVDLKREVPLRVGELGKELTSASYYPRFNFLEVSTPGDWNGPGISSSYRWRYTGNARGLTSDLLDPAFSFQRLKSAGEEENYVYAINGRLEIPDISDRFTIGASLLSYEKREGHTSKSGAVTRFDGRVKLTDIITLSGGVAQHSGVYPPDDVNVDTRAKVGVVSIGATYEPLDPFPRRGTDEDDSTGGASWTRLNLSDLIAPAVIRGEEGTAGSSAEGDAPQGEVITTRKVGLTIGEPGKSEIQVDHELTAIKGSLLNEKNSAMTKTITSFALKYALTDAITLQAGYKLASPSPDSEGKGEKETTRFGVGYRVPLNGEGLLSAYYVYERIKDLLTMEGRDEMLATSTELEYKLTEDTTLKANYLFGGSAGAGRMLSTAVGVGYSFNMDAFLSIGYKMVDFDNYADSKEKFRANMTMAEMTIKF